MLRGIEIRAFIKKIGLFAQNAKAMGKIRGDVKSQVVLPRENDSQPLPKSGGSSPDIHSNIEDLS